MVLIENVGNLVCPALFDLGERAKVVILSVTEGDDKPLKYPHMFRAAEMMVLNKIDLLPHVDFDVWAGARRRAPGQSVDRLDPPVGAHRRGTRGVVRLAAPGIGAGSRSRVHVERIAQGLSRAPSSTVPFKGPRGDFESLLGTVNANKYWQFSVSSLAERGGDS